MNFLTLPGWQGSGPSHWQTLWESLDPTLRRVQQREWDHPSLPQWRAALEDAVTGPSVLIAHSLGCHLATHATAPVCAALLVAPPDLSREDLPREVHDFRPQRATPLPFPALVAASRDDPWCTLERARALAAAWGATFVDLGARGHVNSASNLGTWPEGRELLRSLCARLPFELDPRLAADTLPVGASEFSLLRLMNDARYPWFLIVPRRSALTEAFQLDDGERRLLADSSMALTVAMQRAFRPDKLNVGALGNVVSQLHVHHVARRLGDPAWPGPVWGHSPATPLTPQAARARVDALFGQPEVARWWARVA